MSNRFDRINNQAPAQTQLQKDSSPVGRSAHDFSFIHSGNALFGGIYVIDCFDVVPNEDIEINLSALLEFRNPTVRQLLNSCRVYFHAYYNRLSDLWEGAKNWIDKGRSGKIDLTRPNLIYKVGVDSVNFTVEGTTFKHLDVNANTPMSLLNMLGLPPEALSKEYRPSFDTLSDLTKYSPIRSFEPAFSSIVKSGDVVVSSYTKLGESVDYFPADCAFAYQRNWRDFYANKNLASYVDRQMHNQQENNLQIHLG